jgi:hypothetical protein
VTAVAHALAPTPDERLTRFLTQSNHWHREGHRVSSNAFLPARSATGLSVFRTAGLDAREVWALGDLHVVPSPGRRVRGTATVSASVVTTMGLSLVRDDVPPRHAEIRSWPDDKEARKQYALELAAAASLALRDLP